MNFFVSVFVDYSVQVNFYLHHRFSLVWWTFLSDRSSRHPWLKIGSFSEDNPK